ncbi:MAG: phage head-tail connector protein [Rhizobiales bacterium]|nr:phage head-tail connector protein [Hyphomicrobiales bacterium]
MPMISFLVDGPQLEPVSLMEAKAWLRVDGAEEDSLIQALIVSARLMVEAQIGRVLLAQNWRLIGDAWPPGESIPVKIGKVISVAGGRVFPAEGAPELMSSDDFAIERGVEHDTIVPQRRPVPGRRRSGIEIDLRLGFGEMGTDVPEPLRLAIRHLLTHGFEQRGDMTEPARGLPPMVTQLLQPYRSVRL